jgi:hypothetical protein
MKKNLRKEFKELKEKYKSMCNSARAYILSTRSVGNRRELMTVAPCNDKGMINGLTIPELVMLVNLTAGTNEHIILETTNDKRNLLVVAKKNPMPIPYEFL